MSIKSILCIFEGAEDELNAVNTAFLLAETFGAKIRFLHLSQEYISIYDEGMIINMEMAAQIEVINKKRLEEVKKHIKSMAARHHIPFDNNESSAHHAHAQLEHRVGNIDAAIEQAGCASDIIIIGRSNADTLYNYIVSTSLFHTGRPVLIVPPVDCKFPAQWRDKIISIAWDGSIEAARSIFNSMTLLERAEKLYLLVIRDHNKVDKISANQEMMEYFSAHGIHVNCIIMDGNSHSAAEVVLEKAKELESDLLIMGAYGHNRFREMILGGFTKHMLEKADIPVVFSH